MPRSIQKHPWEWTYIFFFPFECTILLAKVYLKNSPFLDHTAKPNSPSHFPCQRSDLENETCSLTPLEAPTKLSEVSTFTFSLTLFTVSCINYICIDPLRFFSSSKTVVFGSVQLYPYWMWWATTVHKYRFLARWGRWARFGACTCDLNVGV